MSDAASGSDQAPVPRRVKVVERFEGPRVRQRTGVWRRTRSTVLLLILAGLLAAVVASALTGLVAGIAYLIHQATSA